MPLICHNGQIAISDMMNLSNQNETDVAANAANIALNLTSLIAHGTEIIDLDNRLDLIEGGPSLPALEIQVQANTDAISAANIVTGNIETDVTLIQTNVSDNSTDISTNESDIADIKADILLLSGGAVGLTNADALTATSATNKLVTQADMAVEMAIAVPGIITDIFYKTRDQNFLIVTHKEATAVSGGASVAGSWQVRKLNTLVADYIGSVLIGDRLTLSVGTYEVDGYAECVGGYNQSRLYNETDGSTVVLGSSQNGSKSILKGTFTLTVDSVLRLETQTNTSDTNGHGEPNPFDEGIFSMIHIKRIGD